MGTGVRLCGAVTRRGTVARTAARAETGGIDVVTGGGGAEVVGATVVGGTDDVDVAGADVDDRDWAGTRDSLFSTVEVET